MTGLHSRLSAIAACSLLLAGCGSSAPVRYYTLDTGDTANASAAVSTDFAVVIGPFRFAECLQRAHIVSRADETQLVIAEFDRWASPLPDMFQRTLTDRISADLESARVVEFPTTLQAGTGYQVSGRVSRFDTDAAGRATLIVQWGIRDNGGEVLREPARSTYRSNAAGENYAARVRAQSDTLAGFSRDIAAAIRALQSAAQPESG